MDNQWETAMSDAAGKKLVGLDTPIILRPGEGDPEASIEDLPAKSLELSRGANNSHVFEIWEGKVEGGLDLDDLQAKFETKAYDALPYPLAPKAAVPCEYTMQVAVKVLNVATERKDVVERTEAEIDVKYLVAIKVLSVATERKDVV